MADEVEPEITKRRVVMRHPGYGGASAEVTDYVLPEHLDQYKAHHEALGWEIIEVSQEPDAGPAGYWGDTHSTTFTNQEV